MSGQDFDSYTDVETVNLKFAYYRQPRDVFFRLQEKRARGEKINFKERGNDHLFTSATRELTAEELRQFCGSGYFVAEHLAGRTAVDWSFVIVAPDVQVSTGAQPQQQAAILTTPAAPAVVPPAVNTPAQAIRDAVDAGLAFHNAAREIAAPTAAPLTRDDVAQIVAQQLAKVTPAASVPAPPPQRTAADNINEIVAVVSAVDKLRGEKNPAPPPQQADPIESFLSMYERVTELSERVNPSPEGKGWLDKLGSGVESLSRAAEKSAPMIMRLMAARQGAQMAPPVQPGAQPQPGAEVAPQGPQTQEQPQQQQLPAALAASIRPLTKAVTQNNVEGGADILESLFKADPSLIFELQPLLTMPSVALLEWLAATASAPWLADLPHGVTYFDELREELTARSQGEQSDEDEEGETTPVQSANGHRPNGVAVTQ